MELLIAVGVLGYMAACAWAASRMAAGKNRGTDEWFVCGEIFGFFALVALLLLPHLRRDVPEKRDRSEV